MFKVFRCDSCGLAYSYPFLSVDEERKLYEDYFAHHIHENISTNQVAIQFKCQNLLDDILGGYFFKSRNIWLKKLLSSFLFQRILTTYPIFSCVKDKPLKILDIGCGDGHFLSKAKRFGCVCFGTEYHDTLVNRLNANGIIATKEIKDFVGRVKAEADKFDIIRINWVLEHVANPGGILEDAHKLLNDDGELIIGVPNFDTFANIFKEDFQMHLPQHRQLFTKKSIIGLLKRHEFKVIFYRTKSLGIIGPSLARKLRLKNVNSLLRLIDILFSMALDLFNRGDCIEVYCRKT